jgi:hypothetical protein
MTDSISFLRTSYREKIFDCNDAVGKIIRNSIACGLATPMRLQVAGRKSRLWIMGYRLWERCVSALLP